MVTHWKYEMVSKPKCDHVWKTKGGEKRNVRKKKKNSIIVSLSEQITHNISRVEVPQLNQLQLYHSFMNSDTKQNSDVDKLYVATKSTKLQRRDTRTPSVCSLFSGAVYSNQQKPPPFDHKKRIPPPPSTASFKRSKWKRIRYRKKIKSVVKAYSSMDTTTPGQQLRINKQVT